MNLFEVVSPFEPSGDQPKAIESLLDGITQGIAYQTLLGVTGSGKTFTMAHVIAKTQRPALILAHNKTLAAQLYGEMKAIFPNNAVEYFVSYYDYYQPEAYVPSTDTFIDKDASINEHIEQMRLSATKAIIERRDAIIIATVSAIYGLGDPEVYLSMILQLSCGDQIDQRTVLRRLTEMQYRRNEISFERGTYRVRGDVVDVFPADSNQLAIRIELFDDRIENLTYFDSLTGKTGNNVNRVIIFPKTHYVTPKDKIIEVADFIKEELADRLKFFRSENKLLEAQRLEQRTLYDLEMMTELGYCSGIENYSRYLSGRNTGDAPPTLMDYLPSDALLFIDESHVTVPQIGGMYLGDRSRKETLVNYGFRLPSALDNRPLRFDEFVTRIPQTIFVSATPGNYELSNSSQIVEQIIRPTGLIDPEIEVRPILSQVDDLYSEIKERSSRNERVMVTTLTKRMAEDLTEYFFNQGIRVRYIHSDIHTVERVEIIRDFRLGAFDVLIGINLLREGLDVPEVSLVAILDADKEGFLRSGRSLIQTMGRAARNIHGKAILYADRITDSMSYAINETDRRRQKQSEYNAAHNITPKSIETGIRDIMKDAYKTSPNSKKSNAFRSESKNQDYSNLSEKALAKKIKQLEKQMARHAKKLEFEEAAKIRDEIQLAMETLVFLR